MKPLALESNLVFSSSLDESSEDHRPTRELNLAQLSQKGSQT